MVRSPQKENQAVKKGAWTPEEDRKLITYIQRYGIWNWSQMPKFAGLSRSGKSCRLRWLNYLSPDVKRGNFTEKEVETIINMYQKLGSRWCLMAKELPGRTDNEIKNYWHTRLKKFFINKQNNFAPGIQSPKAQSLISDDHESIQQNTHEIESSPFDNNPEVSILQGYYNQVASNVQASDSSSTTTLGSCWDFEGDRAERRQLETAFAEMNIRDSQTLWTQDFMLENLGMEEQQVEFLHSDDQFGLPSWSLDPLSPSSRFYNDIYCDNLYNFPVERGITHFEEPSFWF